MRTKRLLKVCVWGALSALAPGVVANAPAIAASPRAIEGGQALLAIETHRAAIVERLVADYAEGLAQRRLDAGALRAALTALRADQLLAATLVNTLDEVLRVVLEPVVAMGAVGQRYVAITPTEALELRAVPNAQAYLVRDGETLSVVKPAELQLTGRNRVVGYFTADTGTSVTTVIQEKPLGKDGSGSGANSWIGYTAGGNVASGSGSAVAAGTSNVASGQNSFVGAGTFNVANAQGAFVGGGTSNVANGISSLVMGGFDNQATVIDALVVAGAGNRATGARSVVVGGGYNVASGQWSFIGGGGRQTANSGAAGTHFEDNVAAGNFSTIGGGVGNRTGPDSYSTVGGGFVNKASGLFATVGGGSGNIASGVFDTVDGGDGNTASGGHGTVGGGISNTASNSFATVAGGGGNTASGDSSAVGGGSENTASGVASFVGGGQFNAAAGSFSVALGRRAKVFSNGSFVFSDGNGADFVSGVANEFIVGATGGIGMWTSKTFLTGCYIGGGGGSWNCTSSREVKRDFAAVDAEQVLHKVAALPLSTWRFVNEDPAIRHLGPMAQDFRAAFGLGTDDKTIGTVDANGVALAAIQGLNQKVEEKDAKIDAQAKRIADLEKRFTALETTKDELATLKAALVDLLRQRSDMTEARLPF